MHGRGGVRRPARTRGAPGRALRGWPSQRGRRRDDGGRDRLGSHQVGSHVEIAVKWAKAVRVEVLYGPVQVSFGAAGV